jgi:hypothetical protein
MSSKLREVLVEVESILSTWIDHLPPVVQEEAREALNKAEAVINEPLKNCDIGTAEEQLKRHSKWCATSKDFSCAPTMCRKCFANWSQMPYDGNVEV